MRVTSLGRLSAPVGYVSSAGRNHGAGRMTCSAHRSFRVAAAQMTNGTRPARTVAPTLAEEVAPMSQARFVLRATAAAALVVTVGLLVAATPMRGSASPATALSPIAVDTFTDSLAIDGHCSLREAVLAAGRGGPVDSCSG